jgi:hypothetical protein
MDVTKAIEFLIQNQAAFESAQAAAHAAHNERLTRLETLMGVMADKTNHLDDVMVTLAESHIRLVERMEVVHQQSVERDMQLGERIESLAGAIGEFIRNRPSTS